MVEDKSDYTQFYSREEVAKARVEAAQLLREQYRTTPVSGDSDSGQSDEDYEENGPRCFNPSPQVQREIMIDSINGQIKELESGRAHLYSLANNLGYIAGCFGTAIGCGLTKDIEHGLVAGICTGFATKFGIKAINYFSRERPIKNLVAQRDKLSILEKQ